MQLLLENQYYIWMERKKEWLAPSEAEMIQTQRILHFKITYAIMSTDKSENSLQGQKE